MFAEVTDEFYDEKTAMPEHNLSPNGPKWTDTKQVPGISQPTSTSSLSKCCSLCLVPSPNHRQRSRKKTSRKVQTELPEHSSRSIHVRGNPEGETGVEQMSFFRDDGSCNTFLPAKDQQVRPPPSFKCTPNPLAQVMPGQMVSAGGAPPLTASILAAAPPQEQKQMLGERLFPLIQRIVPDLAGKITGMLLEIDNAELVNMLEDHNSLKGKVGRFI